MEPTFFASPAELRAWLDEHHESERELWVGLYKRATGRPSVSWREAVDEALCFGWIDGLTRSLGDEAYMIRFTPRRRGSNWSMVNIARVRELTEQGRMRPAGVAAFEARDEARSRSYSHEQRQAATLEPEQEARLRADAAAWEWFSAQPPSYRKTATWWVVSAKRAETRERRLSQLIECSATGQPVPPLRRPR